MKILAVFCAIVLIWVVDCSYISSVLSHAAVQAPNRRRQTKEVVIDFDAFGNVPKLEDAYRDLEENSLPICAIRFQNHNTTSGKTSEGILLAYGTLPSLISEQAESRQTRSFLQTQRLQKKIGLHICAPLIGSDSQRILMTGRTGDARAVLRLALQTSSNHTFAFDSSASGKYIAEKLGQYLQRTTMEGGNLLRTHVFIASATETHPVSLHSVDAGGNVIEVVAGNAGRHKKLGSEELETNFRFNLTLAEAQELARKVINPPTTTKMVLGLDQEFGGNEMVGDALSRPYREKKSSETPIEDDNEEEGGSGEDDLSPKVWNRLELDVNFEIVLFGCKKV